MESSYTTFVFLQIMTEKNILITTSIAYVNGTPHVGFAMESIEADAYARWNRKKGNNVFFLTGTDEHGSKVYQTALEKGISAQKLTDTNAAEFQRLGKVLHISNDDFIRTTQERHKKGAQEMWKRICNSGDLVSNEFEGEYCVGCETFLTKKDLTPEGKCPHHLKKPEHITEENIFFRLSEYSKEIEELLEQNTLKILPPFRKNEILSFVKEGLKDISFSRPKKTLPWGITVPDYDDQVMYVWCDALSNYYTAVGFGTNDEWKKYWEQGEVVHFIGKDILRFHAGIWPAMLLSAHLPLPDIIAVHGFLTSEGQKMSKSLGNVVDPFTIVEEYGGNPDPLRYFLLAEVPFGRDADFSQKRFVEIYNAHLANGLGNTLTRVLTLAKKAEVPFPVSRQWQIENDTLREKVCHVEEKVDAAMKELEFHNALAEILSVVEELNGYIDSEKPWIRIKQDKEKAKKSIQSCLIALQKIGEEISPFLPCTGEKILQALQTGESDILFPRKEEKMEI